MTLSWLHRALRSVLLLLLATCALPVAAQTPNPAYLADMPSVDRVKAQIQGKDPTDTAARQVAVLTYLQQYIQRIAYNKNVRAPYTPDESRIVGLYYAAALQITNDYNKSHTPAEAKTFDMLQFNYTMNNANDWIKGLIGPQTASAYQGAIGQMAAGQKAHIDSINRANEQAKGAASGSSTGLDSNVFTFLKNDPTDPSSRRCMELSGTSSMCLGMGLMTGLVSAMTGGAASQLNAVRNGPILSGFYRSSGSLGISFGQLASIQSCGVLDNSDSRDYTLTRAPNGVIRIALRNDAASIALTMQPNGALVGPGSVDVHGRVITGYNTVTKTLYVNGQRAVGAQYGCTGGCTQTVASVPVYAPKTDRCTIAGLAAPSPAVPQQSSNPVMNELFGPASSQPVPVGLRMSGRYASPSGLLLSFSDDGGAGVILDCGAAHAEQPYTVDNTPSGIIIHIHNAGGPFDLAVAPDNSLRGSGTTAVNGRLYTGMNSNNDPNFKPVSQSCAVGNFTPASPQQYQALITRPAATASVQNR